MAFQLKSDKKQTENKTIRFPVDLIEKINKAITGEDVTFSKFVIQACQYAIDDMVIKEKDDIAKRERELTLKKVENTKQKKTK